LAEALARYKVSVFFDEHEKATLWGKDLYAFLSDLYQNRARFCVMFLSKHYAAKLWTNHERKAAQARAFRDNHEYVLPIRLDDTEIPGIPSTLGFLAWPPEDAETIAKALRVKIDQDTADLGATSTYSRLEVVRARTRAGDIHRSSSGQAVSKKAEQALLHDRGNAGSHSKLRKLIYLLVVLPVSALIWVLLFASLDLSNGAILDPMSFIQGDGGGLFFGILLSLCVALASTLITAVIPIVKHFSFPSWTQWSKLTAFVACGKILGAALGAGAFHLVLYSPWLTALGGMLGEFSGGMTGLLESAPPKSTGAPLRRSRLAVVGFYLFLLATAVCREILSPVVKTWHAHQAGVNALAFGPKGLISAGDDGKASLWRYPSGDLIRSLYGEGDSQFKQLSVLWKSQAVATLERIMDPNRKNWFLDFSPAKYRIRIWDMKTGEKKRAFSGVFFEDLDGFAFSSKGDSLYVAAPLFLVIGNWPGVQNFGRFRVPALTVR